MYICQCHSLTSSQHTLPPRHVHKFILYICIFIPVLLLGFQNLFFFFRFHTYLLAYSICFSLSDLLHSVRQTLGPSTSLQIAHFRFFSWLSNIVVVFYLDHLSILLDEFNLFTFNILTDIAVFMSAILQRFLFTVFFLTFDLAKYFFFLNEPFSYIFCDYF